MSTKRKAVKKERLELHQTLYSHIFQNFRADSAEEVQRSETPSTHCVHDEETSNNLHFLCAPLQYCARAC